MTTGVGSIIWVFDGNRRVYDKEKGGGPIYRERWRKTKSIGETTRSWIIDFWDPKIPKKGPWIGVVFSVKELEDRVWANENCYSIAESVRRLKNVETLRAVAILVGFENC